MNRSFSGQVEWQKSGCSHIPFINVLSGHRAPGRSDGEMSQEARTTVLDKAFNNVNIRVPVATTPGRYRAIYCYLAGIELNRKQSSLEKPLRKGNFTPTIIIQARAVPATRSSRNRLFCRDAAGATRHAVVQRRRKRQGVHQLRDALGALRAHHEPRYSDTKKRG